MNLRSAVVTLCGMLLAAAAVLWLFDREISGALVPPRGAAGDHLRAGALDGGPEGARPLRPASTGTTTAPASRPPRSCSTTCASWSTTARGSPGAGRRSSSPPSSPCWPWPAALHLLRQGRLDARLERLRLGLIALSDGEEDLAIGDRGRDTVGRIAGMIEETSRAMARDRKRLAYLKNLSGWQETARRHAHEIRTPLTAARLELARLERAARRRRARRRRGRWPRSVGEELERLGRFTQQFTSFARLPQPRRQVHDLGRRGRGVRHHLRRRLAQPRRSASSRRGSPCRRRSTATCSGRCW